MSATISLRINGEVVAVAPNTTVAGAIGQRRVKTFRRSVSGQPRGPLCGMGVCYECRVTIDGVPHRLSCQTLCRPGMEVCTDAR